MNSNELLNVLSILLGLQNLQENREQSAHNDVQVANEQQAKLILEEVRALVKDVHSHLAKQDDILSEIYRKVVLEVDNGDT